MQSSTEQPPQPSVFQVLAPKWRTALARRRHQSTRNSAGRILLLTVAAMGFLTAIFGLSWRTLSYLHSVPEIGPLLAAKLLGVAFLAFGSILFLSNLISALSIFFLARDLDMLMASPLDWGRFYLARLTETIIHSSWMIALMLLPILAAYGIIWQGGPLFPLIVLAALIPFLVIPAVAGTIVTTLLVNLFPARRAREILGMLMILMAGVLLVFLRLLKPEQLARPEGFASLVDFIAVLRTPTHPLLPSEWISAMLMNWLTRIGDPLPVLLLWSTAGAFVVIGASIHHRLYDQGFSRAQEGASRPTHSTLWPRVVYRMLHRASPLTREFVYKDIATFLRDSTQWSQLILLGVLIAVYLFNIKSLPISSGEGIPAFMVTLVVFLNQGLSGFVIAAVAARFIFPAVSLEGRQLWLLRSSPLDLRLMLLSKYLVGITPLLILALILTIATNLLLNASPFMMAVSIFTVVIYTLATGAMALGLGALYPQFDTENAAQIPTSFGGFVYMLLAVVLLAGVITLEAIPVRSWLIASREEVPLTLGAAGWLSFGAALLLCVLAAGLALRGATRRLEELPN